MKKLVVVITIFFISMGVVNAKDEVELHKCVDGDTAWFIVNNEKTKFRFLAINTPESTNKKELYGKEASQFTCNLLTNADKIEIEYDENSKTTDNYDRNLVWVFVDDKLLQEVILKNGFGEVDYLYGDYKYTDILIKAEKDAKNNQLGIWSNKNDNDLYNYIYFGILILILIIICIFSKKVRNNVIKKAKSSLKKQFKKELKKAYKNL